jgi:hypothetical protein
VRGCDWRRRGTIELERVIERDVAGDGGDGRRHASFILDVEQRPATHARASLAS